MKKQQTTTPLQHLGAALQGQIEDTLTCDQCQARLPDYLQAESAGAPLPVAPHLIAMRNHIALCPYCTAAYQQVGEWLLASYQDAIAGAVVYPTFALAFDQPSTPTTSPFAWPVALVQQQRQQGQQWLREASGALYLFFRSPSVSTKAGWAIKSGAAETLLARSTIGEDELPGWEIEATIYATTADRCRMEVSLYAFTPRPNEGAGIRIALYDGIHEQFALTDPHGLVEFDAIPRDRLDTLMVLVDLPDADQAGAPIKTKGAQ